jgi:pilus assembly protein CpaB
VNLVVADRDMPAGTLIHDADLRMAPWAGPVPKGSTLKRDALLNRGVLSSIYEGEPVTETRLAAAGSGGGLAATIPPGMRATAVKVNEVVGVAGFVVPGMRVDVLITGLPPGGNALYGPRVRTLLQNIQVLSAGTNFQKDQEGKPEQAQVVNLLVTPTQAEILSLASNETRIQLILRNPMDTQLSRPPGTDMSDLFGGVAHVPEPVLPERIQSAAPVVRVATPPIVAPVGPSPYVIQVTNGSVRTTATFSRPAGEQ